MNFLPCQIFFAKSGPSVREVGVWAIRVDVENFEYPDYPQSFKPMEGTHFHFLGNRVSTLLDSHAEASNEAVAIQCFPSLESDFTLPPGRQSNKSCQISAWPHWGNSGSPKGGERFNANREWQKLANEYSRNAQNVTGNRL